MGDFDAPEKAARLKEDADSGISISDAYNSLDKDQREAAFNEMTASENTDDGLSDLIITGLDTDGDRQADELQDILNPKTGADLYNRPGEGDHSDEAWNNRWRRLIKEDPEFQEYFREFIGGGRLFKA